MEPSRADLLTAANVLRERAEFYGNSDDGLKDRLLRVADKLVTDARV